MLARHRQRCSALDAGVPAEAEWMLAPDEERAPQWTLASLLLLAQTSTQLPPALDPRA
jgi:hypothetical protein